MSRGIGYIGVKIVSKLLARVLDRNAEGQLQTESFPT
jgi:hypothetical protein